MATPLSGDEDAFNLRSDEIGFDDYAYEDMGQDEVAVGHGRHAPEAESFKPGQAVKRPKAPLTPASNASHKVIVNFGTSNRDTCPIAETLTLSELIKQFAVNRPGN